MGWYKLVANSKAGTLVTYLVNIERS